MVSLPVPAGVPIAVSVDTPPKVAAHVTHGGRRMEYMLQLLELLGIERGRVLFENQVGESDIDALAERHGLRHANDHWQRFTMCSVYHCGKGGSTDASQSTRQAGAELPVCIRMTRERFKAAHPTLIALPTMPDVSIAGPRRPRYSSYFKSLRQGQ